jgi:hypothetical protein
VTGELRPGPRCAGPAGRLGALAFLVVALAAAPAFGHPEPGDIDGDNVLNEVDNCPSVYNPDQSDVDGTPGVGDRCDPDHDADGDGVVARTDNCPKTPNPDQADSNGDGRGDACAIDSDGDTIFDFEDNCQSVPNRFQGNNDNDDFGDACDDDIDGDDIDSPADLRNATDNCPTVYNPDQRDDDRDGLGALCDADDLPRGGGGAGGGGPAAGAGPGARDSTAPRVTVRLARTHRFEAVRDGLVVPIRCSEACSATVRLTIDRRRARALRLPRSGMVARGSAQLGAAGSTYAFARFTKGARRRLLRGRRGVRARLRVIVVDRAQNRRTVTRRVTLRR